MANALEQLAYVSAAKMNFSEVDLAELLKQARAKNERLNVTGLLLYKDKSFLQVLEGDPEIIEALYDTIAADKRHTHVTRVFKREIEKRTFSEWRMAYAIITHHELERLAGHVHFAEATNFHDISGDSAIIERILDGFKEGKWRQRLV